MFFLKWLVPITTENLVINTINKIINNNSRVRLNRVGGWVAGRRSWVVGRVCLKIKKEIYISSLSALSKFAIARINFPELLYEMLNKGKLSPNTINIFSSGLANNFGKLHRVFESICLTLARTFAENECINYKKRKLFWTRSFVPELTLME